MSPTPTSRRPAGTRSIPASRRFDTAVVLDHVPTPRPAARVILLDPDDRILLIQIQFDATRTLWLTPGGGLEEGESHEDAARRELFEETGIVDVELGPCVWHRTHVFRFEGVLYEAQERYFVARLAHVPEITTDHRTEIEREMLSDARWWSVDEIAASDETFVPRRLAERLLRLLEGDSAEVAINVGT